MGLLKTGLKAAVAVKTADVIHERIIARQQEQWAGQGHVVQAPAAYGATAPPVAAPPVAAPPAAAAPAAAAPAAGPSGLASTADTLAQLTQLAELRTAGVLTDAEFELQKARILSA